MMISIKNRRGVSLTEVLIAIFVMGIGMISLLALFPVGMMNMHAAIANNRIALVANNAESTVEFGGIRTDSDLIGMAQIQEPFKPYGAANLPSLPQGSLYRFLSDTAINNYVLTGPPANPTGWTNFDVNGPTPPVFVDPVGFFTYGSGVRLGTTVGLYMGIPRTSFSWITTTGQARRWFSLDDDLTFRPDATPNRSPDPLPAGVPAAFVERARRYSWAYMVRRPRFLDPRVVEVSIVLFAGRKLEGTSLIGAPTNERQYFGPSDATPTSNRAFVQGQTTARIRNETGQPWPPQVKPGDWVCDATCKKWVPTPPGSPALYNGYFYQVVSVSEPYTNPAVAGETVVDLELTSPARADGYVALFINGIVDVIEKSDGRMP